MLVKCTECGQEVSDSARVCPHCGYPLQRKAPLVDGFSRRLRRQRVIATIPLVAGVLIVAFLKLIGSSLTNDNIESWYGITFVLIAVIGFAAVVVGGIWHLVIALRLWWHRI